MSIFGSKIQNGQQLAADTRQRMTRTFWGGVPSSEDQIELAEDFFHKLPQMQPTPLERALGEVAQSGGSELSGATARLDLYTQTVEALAAPRPGSAGKVLAEVAHRTLQKSTGLSGDERARLTRRFLEAVPSAGAASQEASLAQTMLQTSEGLPQAMRSALAEATLQALAQGVGPLTGAMLAHLGSQAMGQAPSPSSDRAALGNALTQTLIQAESATPEQKAFLEQLQGLSQSLPASAQSSLAQAGLEILASPPPPSLSAALAQRALELATSAPPPERWALAHKLQQRLCESSEPGPCQLLHWTAELSSNLPEKVQSLPLQAAFRQLTERTDLNLSLENLLQLSTQAIQLAPAADLSEQAGLARGLLSGISAREECPPPEKQFIETLITTSTALPPAAQTALVQQALVSLKAGSLPQSPEQWSTWAQSAQSLVRPAQPEQVAACARGTWQMLAAHPNQPVSEQAFARVMAESLASASPADQIALSQSAWKLTPQQTQREVAACVADLALNFKGDAKKRLSLQRSLLEQLGKHSDRARDRQLGQSRQRLTPIFKQEPAQAREVEITLKNLQGGLTRVAHALLTSDLSQADRSQLLLPYLGEIASLPNPLVAHIAPLVQQWGTSGHGLKLATETLACLAAEPPAPTNQVATQVLSKLNDLSAHQRLQLARAFVETIAEDTASPQALEKLDEIASLRTPEAATAWLCGFLGDASHQENARQTEMAAVRQAIQMDLEKGWQARLDQELGQMLDLGQTLPPPENLGTLALTGAWAEIQERLEGDIERNPLLAHSTPPERQAALDQSNWQNWAATTRTQLTFGENFPVAEAIPVVYSGKEESEKKQRQSLIEKLSKAQEPADHRDLGLLRGLLEALPTAMLTDLERYKYTIEVTRDRVSNAAEPLQGRLEKSGQLTDMQESAHHGDAQNPRILIRSRWEGNQLKISPDSLVRGLGQAYDRTINPNGSSTPLNESFKSEAATLGGTLQTDLRAFACEMFTRYQLDADRLSREFPLAWGALEKGAFTRHRLDSKKLVDRGSAQPLLVNVSPDPLEALRQAEELNSIHQLQRQAPLPYVYQIQSEKNHNVGLLVDRMASTLRQLRNPENPPYRDGEAVLRLDPASFNNSEVLEVLLNQRIQSGRSVLLVLEDLPAIAADSPGFATLQRYQDRLGGQLPLVMVGRGSDLDRLKPALPSANHRRFRTAPLTRSMIANLVDQKARCEGYQLSQEALQSLLGRAKDGETGQSLSLWRAVKTAHAERNGQLLPYLKLVPQAISQVISRDVEQAKIVEDRDPLQELDRLVGLEAAKQELRTVIAELGLEKIRAEYGLSEEPPRLNLLFEGNPGTGKTSMAKLFGEALTRLGYLKNNKFKEVRVQDLLADNTPEENVKRLFEENKGGVIFIDEMHQLKDTQEGRLAFRAMIPYLGHPEYADTVFIGAGYKGEMLDLIRDTDDGAERRFSSVPFQDYNRQELGQILDKMAVDKQRTLDPATREAALTRLERERRKMKHFGNAGSVQSVLELAIKKQTTRLSDCHDPLTKEQMMALIPEDFVHEKMLTPEEVWKEIDALEGLHSLKEELHMLCDSIEYDRDEGLDPLENFEPYFILDGPPGTGKSTMARLIVKLMAAYDIIPGDGISESQGADLQAGYVGQTTDKVQKMFEAMWGQGGFIDEIGGLARAPEAFKTDAVKTLLKEMEDNRGRYVLVVADYYDRVNDFLNIDDGIARRFGHRFSLEPLSAEQAVHSLCQQLTGKELQISEPVRQQIEQGMEQLHEAPGWASSGDVRKLLNTIITQQKSAFLEEQAAGHQVTAKQLLPQAVQAGFDKLLAEKEARQLPMEERKKDQGVQSEAATATQKPEQEDPLEEVKLTTQEQALLDNQAQVDQEFASQLANDPALQARWESSSDSAYIRRLAEKMGVTPEEALQALSRVKKKVKKMVSDVRLVQRFVYHCPYCGGIESPNCAYIGNSLDWKIQHSLKKPWTEAVREEKEVEVDSDS